MDNIYIRSKQLPRLVNGMTVLDDAGDYNVYIEEALSDEAKERIFMHEIKHINASNFWCSGLIWEIEK